MKTKQTKGRFNETKKNLTKSKYAPNMQIHHLLAHDQLALDRIDSNKVEWMLGSLSMY